MICNNLTIKHKSRELVNINFEINHSLALVGQSGSGKSLTLKALISLLPSSLKSTMDIESDFDLIRGDTISFVPQNAFTALSPMSKIKNQWLGSTLHREELFGLLGLDISLIDSFPSELSGGQQQRMIVAMALSFDPKLLLLDEPTTALDPKLREDMIEILLRLQDKFGFLMLFVTHDIEVARRLCRDIVVLKDGVVVESGTAIDIIQNPKESYTKRLIESSFANREFRR